MRDILPLFVEKNACKWHAQIVQVHARCGTSSSVIMANRANNPCRLQPAVLYCSGFVLAWDSRPVECARGLAQGSAPAILRELQRITASVLI